MTKKILITKGKVHHTCWKCLIPFFRHFHYKRLDKQGYLGGYFYPSKSKEKFEVYNEDEIIHENKLKSEEWKQIVTKSQTQADSTESVS